MSKPKRHPADAFDGPPPGEFLSNAENLPAVRVDKPVSTGSEIPVEPNSGSKEIPTYTEPAPRPGKQLEGSDPGRTGESDAPAPKREKVDDHRHEMGF